MASDLAQAGRRNLNQWASVITGLVYGLALSSLSFLFTGAGHGTYIPLAIFSAPLALCGIVAALCGMPVFWAAIAFLAACSDRLWQKAILFLLLAGHYLTIFFLINGEPFGDWNSFQKVIETSDGAALMTAAMIVYLTGQIVVWVSVVRMSRKKRLIAP